MRYCPHCSESIPDSAKICPNCKKSVEIDLIKSVFGPGEDSSMNKRAWRKLWLKEKSVVIIPVLTLIAGLLIGALIMFIFDQSQFASTRSDYEERIGQLEDSLKNQKLVVSNSEKIFSDQLQAKDETIAILTEEMDILGKVLNFTNRLARNSTITPNTPEEEDYFRRNILYLNAQFNQQEEKLQDAGYQRERNFNLLLIPQFLSD
jgi:uncharacterized membrane protein YvbJ